MGAQNGAICVNMNITQGDMGGRDEPGKLNCTVTIKES